MQAVIFDVDGTLYKQNNVRIGMACKLFFWYIVHPHRICELLGILFYRKAREDERMHGCCDKEYVEYAAKKVHISQDSLEAAINKWMFDEPLQLIKNNQRKNVIKYLRNKQDEGLLIVAYSDYNPVQKLEVLDIKANKIFYPGYGIIDELKPSKEAMTQIMESISFTADEVVYIGDRLEKDGVSAQLVGVKYIDIKNSKELSV